MGLMKSSRVAGLITPKYCCCVIPSVNTGAYLVLIEQGLMGLGLGILAVASPAVVGTSFPSFANYIFAVLCWIVAAVQPVGFIGVLREKTTTFRVYSWINAIFTILAFLCAAALIVVSAVQHEHAVDACQLNFFNTPASSNSTSSGGLFSGNATETLNTEAKTLCSPFAWADVGILGGLWILALLFQGYMIIMTHTYWRSMISDHNLYRSVYYENPEQFTMSILRSTRYNPGSIYNTGGANVTTMHSRDAWDSRPSTESLRDEEGGRSSQYGAPGAFGRSYSNSPLGKELKDELADDGGHGQGQYEQYVEQQGYHQQGHAGGHYGYGASQGMHAGQGGGMAGQGAGRHYDGGYAQ